MKLPEAKTTRTRGSGFRAIAWILLVAFTLQSFVTETHIHGAFQSASTTVAAVVKTEAQKNAPVDNGKAECPFCQAIVHAGAFFAPPAQILILPLSWATIAASFFVVESVVSVSSHRWQSRAPPHH